MQAANSIRVPTSTYRLQLNVDFTFDQAIEILDYLKTLGVSHVYCSPYLQAAPGSMHGYDVTDHQKVNEELGGEAAHQRFCAELKEHGFGQVLDIVPNHMATGSENRYWWDVLENGPSSRYATWFDIDWQSNEVKLQNKILIPVLGDQYGRALSAGQIQIERIGTRFEVRYFDHRFPTAPRALTTVLSKAAEYADNPTLSFVADSFSRLPSPDPGDQDEITSRDRDKAVITELLRRLCEEQPAACKAIETAVEELNRDPDSLDEFLNLQYYRLAFWRTADQELGYRRFFDVNTLIGLRVERPHVFDATHWRILKWLETGAIDGIRIDHPDGLRDPGKYLSRLRSRAPNAWIVAEKILGAGETLREDWPIQGTSGYDFLNLCNGLFQYGDGLLELSEVYKNFTGEPVEFDAIAHSKKLAVEHEALGSDVNRLASLFVEICEKNRDRRDYTRAEIRRAIREVAACFPVYRTYVAPEIDQISDEDKQQIARAIDAAKGQRGDLDSALFDFIGDVLSMRVRGMGEAEFIYRFQQFTSPVMAKGVEDTAFYCFNRMIGLNEVGGAPAENGTSIAAFHERCQKMQAAHPATMTTLTTHDTKRSEDVRARLAVISEMPDRWGTALRQWSRRNARFKTGGFPDRNTEYFLYQTVVGAWPISTERLQEYMEKAAREAKQQTNWTQQNKEFENALREFIKDALGSSEFVAAVQTLVDLIAESGRVNSLAQTLLKLTAPGVPDTYQGSELWDLRLVDPDNRGPVDYPERHAMLKELEKGVKLEEIVKRSASGIPKLWLVYRVQNLRRMNPEWFGAGAAYVPLAVSGSKVEHVVAYMRGDHVATIVPRWNLKLGRGWGATSVALPAGRWKNVLTGDVVNGGLVRITTLLARFPVGLFTKETE